MCLDVEYNAAATIVLGPFVDDADGVTPITGLSAPTAMRVWKNGTTSTIDVSSGGRTWTHRADGYYEVGLLAGDFSALGRLKIEMSDSSTYYPVSAEFRVLAANAFATFYGSANLQVDLVKIDGNATNTTAATLNLKQLNIANGAGDGVVISGSGAGVIASSTGTGSGVSILGGSSGGSGLSVSGGAGGGSAALFQGNSGGAGGAGIYCKGNGTAGQGLVAEGTGGGILALATGTGNGFQATGAPATDSHSAGAGIVAIGGDGGGSGSSFNPGSPGMYVQGGAGAGTGVDAKPGGDGINCNGGGPGGVGFVIKGANSSADFPGGNAMELTGGTGGGAGLSAEGGRADANGDSGPGLVAQGGGNGNVGLTASGSPGILAVGGDTVSEDENSGPGILALGGEIPDGQHNGAGAAFIGSGLASGSGSGDGVLIVGGGTGGANVPTGTNTGLRVKSGFSAGSGIAVDGATTGDIQANLTGTIGGVTTSAGNQIADHTLRRKWSNAWGSSAGDTPTPRSMLGAMARLVNKVTMSSSTMTVYQDDDATTLTTANVGTDTAAKPIVSVDPAP